MTNVAARPTLLVFTRGPAGETRRRRLLPARLEPVERDLHRRCVTGLLEAGREAGCGLVVSSPSAAGVELDRCSGDIVRLTQEAAGFDARLRSAVRQTRALAAGPVLIVGTDTPALGTEHLRAALARLEADPEAVVVGPAPDGGLYLLASRRPLDGVLARVRWQRPDTLDSLLAALAAAGIRAHLLEPLADLDRPQDLARWVSRGGTPVWRSLVRRVREALAALRRHAVPRTLGQPSRLAAAFASGRAPPAAL